MSKLPAAPPTYAELDQYAQDLEVIINGLCFAAKASFTDPNLSFTLLKIVDKLAFEVGKDDVYLITRTIGFNAARSMANKNMCSVRDKEPFIYFMETSLGLVKIGTSRDVEKRMKQLKHFPNSKLLLKIPGGSREEAFLHRLFRDYRCGNTELFSDNEVLRDFVSAIEREDIRLLVDGKSYGERKEALRLFAQKALTFNNPVPDNIIELKKESA